MLAGILIATAAGAKPVPHNSIGEVISLQGKVIAKGINGQERILTAKSPVYINDSIETSEKAKLQMRMTDDSILSQGENSSLILDNFVYSPESTNNVNCLMTLTKGAFRVITGKIAALKPEQFNVKTRMATIGIRGCDLAFRVDATGNAKVYVLDLPKNHHIVVEPTEVALAKKKSEAKVPLLAAKAETAVADQAEQIGQELAEEASTTRAAGRSYRMQVNTAGTFVDVRESGEIAPPVEYDRKDLEDLLWATTL